MTTLDCLADAAYSQYLLLEEAKRSLLNFWANEKAFLMIMTPQQKFQIYALLHPEFTPIQVLVFIENRQRNFGLPFNKNIANCFVL